MGRTQYTAALIGTGRIGFTLGFDKKREQPASHTMALLNNRRIRLVAGCDIDSVRLSAWRAFVHRADTFSDAASLLAAVHPDIVVIAAEEAAHEPLALAALAARPRLIILEKPVAVTLTAGRRIAQAAADARVPILINHERRFAVDYAAARCAVQTIGAIQSVTAFLGSSLCVYDPTAESDGSYSLLHDGTHLFDIVPFILGAESAATLTAAEVTSITRHSTNHAQIDQCTVTCRSAVCADIVIRLSGRSRYFAFELDILGTEGRVRIGNGMYEVYRRMPSRLYSGFYSLASDRHTHIPKKTGYFARMVQHAVDYLDGNVPLKSSIADGLAALELIETIKAQLQ
ncbi:MAG: Gfo/Idh/MocA family oxidoreductase [Treponema sp.]|nr:Gfo/Idh/MocA family oxidoreductase [Treponema sp.]